MHVVAGQLCGEALNPAHQCCMVSPLSHLPNPKSGLVINLYLVTKR